ncbi:MAG: SDR family oxidoreductase [Planctomycetes bacterium]|nr:SDR family oxidoreductase [Planctomycetota bacterium]
MGTALVTGASAGLGVEFARLCAADGHAVVLVARRAERLQALADELQRTHGTRCLVVPQDLAAADAAERVLAAITASGLAPPTILINNAGLGAHGPFADTKAETALRQILVNIALPTELTRRCLPAMRTAGHGRILVIASTAAFTPGPLMAVYYATKAHVLSWSEALHEELRGTGITVTCVCPGPVRTEFQQVAGLDGETPVRGLKLMPPEVVARAGYRAMRRGRAIVIPGLWNQVLALCSRLLPRFLLRRIVHRLQRRR